VADDGYLPLACSRGARYSAGFAFTTCGTQRRIRATASSRDTAKPGSAAIGFNLAEGKGMPVISMAVSKGKGLCRPCQRALQAHELGTMNGFEH